MLQPNLHTEGKVLDIELSQQTYRQTEQWAKRIARFTASANHRLMAGVDLTDEDFAKQIENAHLKDELINLCDSHGVDSSGTKGAMAWRLLPFMPKDVLSAGAVTYVKEKVIEVKKGKALETPETYDMIRGKEMEEPTVLHFQKRTGLTVENWGDDQLFLEDVTNEKLKGETGATADGKVSVGGVVYGFEGKAPKETTHYEYLYGSPDGSVPTLTRRNLKELCGNYWWQMITGLLCSDYAGWYFVSFHPDFIDDAEKMLIIRIDRSDADVWADLEKLEKQLLKAVELKYELLNKPLIKSRQ